MPDYKQVMRRKSPGRKANQIIPRTKRSLKKVVLLLIFCALIISIYLGARSFLLNSSGFKIDKVSVVDSQGKPVQNPERFFRLENGLNLFSFDIKRVVEDIKARHPELAAVLIRKHFPNALSITVKMREPVAIVVTKKSSLIDKEGFILPFKSRYQHLPKIVGIGPRQIQLYTKASSLKLNRALELLKELKKAGIYCEYNITQIDVRGLAKQNIVFYLENGTEIKMGQNGFARKAVLLKRILTQLKVSNTVPKYIDMRFEDPSVLP